LFGFPVHLDISFVIIMALFGYRPGVPWVGFAMWLAITPIAVLVHELGHAFAARANGAQPEIALAGFGGVTTYTPPKELSRAQSLAISLAGPGVGLMLGLGLIVLRNSLDDSVIYGSWQYYALEYGVWTCIAWSAFNLLPVLPLDGGQAMRELLPGTPRVRTRRAAGVSIVAATLAAAYAGLRTEYLFAALFMAFFIFSNFMTFRQLSGDDDGDGQATGPAATPESTVVRLLWQSQPSEARQVLESLPPGTSVDLAVHGAVLALTGDAAQGHALITQEVQRRPGDPNAIALLVLTLALEHDWDGLVTTLQGPLGATVPRPVIDRAVEEARGTGREDVAGRLTLLANQR
jgi:Zn-dependent protease